MLNSVNFLPGYYTDYFTFSNSNKYGVLSLLYQGFNIYNVLNK